MGGTLAPDELPEIVGVVGHVLNYQLDSPQYVEVYVPLEQPPEWAGAALLEGNVVLRHAGSPEAAIASVRDAVSSIDPVQPVYGASTLADVVDSALAPERTNGLLSASFASLALALAGIGLYGVLAAIVGRRKREIGLRMALGATPSNVVGAVVGNGMALVSPGLALGLVGAALLSRVVESLVYGAGVFDLDVLAVVLALTSVVALAGCAIPARRAARIEVVDALRID